LKPPRISHILKVPPQTGTVQRTAGFYTKVWWRGLKAKNKTVWTLARRQAKEVQLKMKEGRHIKTGSLTGRDAGNFKRKCIVCALFNAFLPGMAK
jgi:hypothetical protein